MFCWQEASIIFKWNNVFFSFVSISFCCLSHIFVAQSPFICSLVREMNHGKIKSNWKKKKKKKGTDWWLQVLISWTFMVIFASAAVVQSQVCFCVCQLCSCKCVCPWMCVRVCVWVSPAGNFSWQILFVQLKNRQSSDNETILLASDSNGKKRCSSSGDIKTPDSAGSLVILYFSY